MRYNISTNKGNVTRARLQFILFSAFARDIDPAQNVVNHLTIVGFKFHSGDITIVWEIGGQDKTAVEIWPGCGNHISSRQLEDHVRRAHFPTGRKAHRGGHFCDISKRSTGV